MQYVYLVKDKPVCILVCSFVIDSVQHTEKRHLKYHGALLQQATKRPEMTLDQRRTAIGMLIGGASVRERC